MTRDTLLLRQVHPSFVQAGRLTSQVFTPFPKDKGLLSVYDGDRIGPEPSWRHFTSTLGYSSTGVVAVTVAECEVQSLPARPDPEPFPEHAVIDFTQCSPKEIKTKAKALATDAEIRGWLYGPISEE